MKAIGTKKVKEEYRTGLLDTQEVAGLCHFYTYTVRRPPWRLCPKMHTQCQVPVGPENDVAT